MEVDESLQKTKISEEEIQKTVVAVLTYDTREKQAESLGITRQGLYKRILKNPEISKLASMVSKKSEQIMQVASIKASYKLIELLDHPNPKVSIVAATQILDRVGFGKKDAEVKAPSPEPILIKVVDYKST